MNILINLLINALSVYISAKIIPGIEIANFYTAIIVSVVLGVANTFIKPIILILTLPINILSLGLFTLVINALLIMLTAYLVEGFQVPNLIYALIFGFVLSLVSIFLNSLT